MTLFSICGTLGQSLVRCRRAANCQGWGVEAGRKEVSLDHDSLLPGQTYTFTVSQAHDRARNPLTPVWWTFTPEPGGRPRFVYLPLVVKGE